jgi:nitroreductase
METMEAILSRKSIGLVKDLPVPRDLIEQILHAGTYAPNHYRTEPWRFYVLEGGARLRLGHVFEEITKSELDDLTSSASLSKLDRLKKLPLRAPVIISVAVEPQKGKNIVQIEEYAAVHCAVQNMLLTAHSLGLGAIWRTGPLCYHEKTKNFFGLSNEGDLVAFIYLGYPDTAPPTVKKTSFKNLTKWLS